MYFFFCNFKYFLYVFLFANLITACVIVYFFFFICVIYLY